MLMRKDAVKTAVSRFAELSTLQRSVVILSASCRAGPRVETERGWLEIASTPSRGKSPNRRWAG
jgi:hypothetical protein